MEHINSAQKILSTPQFNANSQTLEAQTPNKNCQDFKTQAEAQIYFDSSGGNTINNISRLDGIDRDGKVCENLP